MLTTRIIPVLLFAEGGLVKTRRFTEERYIGDPINAIRIFNEKCADELILLDITASIAGTGPNFTLIEECAGECFMPLAYGGGVSCIEHMSKIFSLGVEKVIVNTAAYGDHSWIREAVAYFGSQSVVVSVDIKKGLLGGYYPMTHRGTRKAPMTLADHLARCQESGFGEIFINTVHADGMQTGYDEAMIRNVADQVSVPLIVCGGAGRPEHLRSAVVAGADAVAAGSLFVFHGKHRAVLITYPDEQMVTDIFAGIAEGSAS